MPQIGVDAFSEKTVRHLQLMALDAVLNQLINLFSIFQKRSGASQHTHWREVKVPWGNANHCCWLTNQK